MYKIKPISSNGDEGCLKGSFYVNELQEVGENDYFPIKAIVKRFPKKKMALISWEGWPESYNSLVPYDQIRTYKDLLDS